MNLWQNDIINSTKPFINRERTPFVSVFEDLICLLWEIGNTRPGFVEVRWCRVGTSSMAIIGLRSRIKVWGFGMFTLGIPVR